MISLLFLTAFAGCAAAGNGHGYSTVESSVNEKAFQFNDLNVTVDNGKYVGASQVSIDMNIATAEILISNDTLNPYVNLTIRGKATPLHSTLDRISFGIWQGSTPGDSSSPSWTATHQLIPGPTYDNKTLIFTAFDEIGNYSDLLLIVRDLLPSEVDVTFEPTQTEVTGVYHLHLNTTYRVNLILSPEVGRVIWMDVDGAEYKISRGVPQSFNFTGQKAISFWGTEDFGQGGNVKSYVVSLEQASQTTDMGNMLAIAMLAIGLGIFALAMISHVRSRRGRQPPRDNSAGPVVQPARVESHQGDRSIQEEAPAEDSWGDERM